jgi:hypothetical protein
MSETCDTCGRPTTISDAGQTAVRPAISLTAAEQRVFAAAQALSSAANAVERHIGARGGADYDAKMVAWRDAYAEFLRTMKAYSRKEAKAA